MWSFSRDKLLSGCSDFAEHRYTMICARYMRQLLSSCMTDYSSLVVFWDLRVHTHTYTHTYTHTHACGGRKDATGRATISEVNLGSDRGNAGAGAF